LAPAGVDAPHRSGPQRTAVGLAPGSEPPRGPYAGRGATGGREGPCLPDGTGRGAGSARHAPRTPPHRPPGIPPGGPHRRRTRGGRRPSDLRASPLAPPTVPSARPDDPQRLGLRLEGTKVPDEGGPFLRIGEPLEGHPIPRRETLGVGQEAVQTRLGPASAEGTQALGVAESRLRSNGPPHDPLQRRTDSGSSELARRVATDAGGEEKVAAHVPGLPHPRSRPKDRHRPTKRA